MSNAEILKLGDKLKNANAAAVNRAAATAVTAVSKLIRDKYNFKKKDLDEHIKIISKASPDNSSVTVKISKAAVALINFNATQVGKGGRPKKGKGPRTKQGVKATVEKGNRLLYRPNTIGSFISTMKSGHTGVFARESNEKNAPIKELWGVNLIQLVNPKSGNSLVMDTLRQTFQDAYEKRLNHEVERRFK